MPDLTKVSERDALKPRRNPYWQRIRPGCFLGYRTSFKGGPGSWIARAYDEETLGYRFKALGSFGEASSRDRFGLAKQEAEAFAAMVEAGGTTTTKIETVADACREYGKVNAEAEGRFKRHLYSDPLAKVTLAKLRRRHVQ